MNDSINSTPSTAKVFEPALTAPVLSLDAPTGRPSPLIIEIDEHIRENLRYFPASMIYSVALSKKHGLEPAGLLGTVLAAISRFDDEPRPFIPGLGFVEERARLAERSKEARVSILRVQAAAQDVLNGNRWVGWEMLHHFDALGIYNGSKTPSEEGPEQLAEEQSHLMRLFNDAATLEIRLAPGERPTPSLRKLAFPLMRAWYELKGAFPEAAFRNLALLEAPAAGTCAGLIVDGLHAAEWNFPLLDVAMEYEPMRQRLKRQIKREHDAEQARRDKPVVLKVVK